MSDSLHIPNTPVDDAAESPPMPAKTGRLRRLAGRVKRLSKPRKAILGLLGIGMLIGTVYLASPARYAVLNFTGNAKIEVTVVDKDTGQFLANASITIGNQQASTNQDGLAHVQGVAFGKQQLTITKEAYHDYQQVVTIEWRTGSLGVIELEPAGIPLQLEAVDVLSGDKIASFTATIQDTDISTKADNDDTAVINVPPPAEREITILITADGYNQASLKLAAIATAEPTTVKMTPAGKHYFLSNAHGTVSIYESNFDGTDRRMVVEDVGVGPVLHSSLYISPDRKFAALRSEKGGQRNEDGHIIPELYIANLQERNIKRVDYGSPGLYMLGWIGNRFYYELDYRDASKEDNHKIKSVDPASSDLQTHIALMHGLEGVYLLGTQLIYQRGYPDYDVYRFDTSDGTQHAIFEEDAYLSSRQSHEKVLLRHNDKYYEYTIDNQLNELEGEPASSGQRGHTKSPGGQHVAWLETRDGRSTVIVDGQAKTSDIIASYISGWVGDRYLIFHSSHDGSTDYVLDTVGGKHLKITDSYESSDEYYYY